MYLFINIYIYADCGACSFAGGHLSRRRRGEACALRQVGGWKLTDYHMRTPTICQWFSHGICRTLLSLAPEAGVVFVGSVEAFRVDCWKKGNMWRMSSWSKTCGYNGSRCYSGCVCVCVCVRVCVFVCVCMCACVHVCV